MRKEEKNQLIETLTEDLIAANIFILLIFQI